VLIIGGGATGCFAARDAAMRGLNVALVEARDFAAAGPLARACRSELSPGPDVRTDAQVREFIRRDLGTLFHPVGTCAMGGDSRLAAIKLTSVVDPELRVRGVEQLRVVDASVMPTPPRANTNLPTMAIAERFAERFA